MTLLDESCGVSCSHECPSCSTNDCVEVVPHCDCECRHVSRFLARAEENGDLLDELKEIDFNVYDDDIVEYEVPTPWDETRVMYVPEAMPFTSALAYYFTRNEVAEMFDAFSQCDCCERHQVDFPVSPFLN